MRSHLVLTPREYEASRAGHFHARRLAFVLEAAATVPDGGTAVELGCGPGATLADFSRARPELRCLGLDVDDAMVAYANDAHGTTGFLRRRAGRARPDPGAGGFRVRDRRPAPRRRPGGVPSRRDRGTRSRRRRRGDRAELTAPVRGAEPGAHAPPGPRRGSLPPRSLGSRHSPPPGCASTSRSWLHAFPACVRSVPTPAARLERLVERVPPLAGSVAYVLRRAEASRSRERTRIDVMSS